MAVKEYEVVHTFDDWYEKRVIDHRDGGFERWALNPCALHNYKMFEQYKSEMDRRVQNFDKLLKVAAGEVLTEKPDLPNVSSGDVAGLVRRGARNIVQNTPNVEIISEFDDDSKEGIFTRYILLSKVIGSDLYSNDMQQNLFASTMSAFTLGFDCVVPVLQQNSAGHWYIHYDSIYYKDVFPEAGARDVRQANVVFIRRYLTKADVHHLINTNAAGWDLDALRQLLKSSPPSRRWESTSHEEKKQGQVPDGYEIITKYTNDGNPFLTFDARSKLLLRIEKSLHPAKTHPVHFLVLEKDPQQPLGKSMVELVLGRQDFQDLLLNGAMKMWHWGINPTMVGRGVNSGTQLGPGKLINLSNPNANIEALEVSTQTLLQHASISQGNLGAMVSTLGAADQQMAASSGNGMSATPQGVDAQQEMVDITTNNYQKAVENFFSHYCSYALTIYFQELKGVQKVKPNAEARQSLLAAGLQLPGIDETGKKIPGDINEDGEIVLDWESLATEYFVRCVPGSLVEMEDEKQLRVLNELFVPLSQAMPALAATEDPDMIKAGVMTMQYIMAKQILLSGARDAQAITEIWKGGDVEAVNSRDARISELEESVGGTTESMELELTSSASAITQLQSQVTELTNNFGLLLQKLGVQGGGSEGGEAAPEEPQMQPQ